MTVEEDTRKNTNDIHALTVNVARLTTIVENAEKRHDSEMVTMKEAIQGINRLNERIGDVSGMRELVSELKGDVRTIRHDLTNAMNAINGISLVNEKLNDATSQIAAQGAKIEGLESFRDKLDGAGIAGLTDRVDKLEKQNSKMDGAGIAGLVDRVDKLEKESTRKDGAVATAKGIWEVISTPFWCAVSAVAVWILTGMYGGKGPIGGE